VFQDGQDLGSAPLTLDVPIGQKLNIEVRREGFKPQAMVVDGVQPKLKVKLVGAAPAAHPVGKPGGGKPAAADAPKPPPAAPPSLGGGEIVNPWAK
jgi:hypothetical protein